MLLAVKWKSDSVRFPGEGRKYVRSHLHEVLRDLGSKDGGEKTCFPFMWQGFGSWG